MLFLKFSSFNVKSFYLNRVQDLHIQYYYSLYLMNLRLFSLNARTNKFTKRKYKQQKYI